MKSSAALTVPVTRITMLKLIAPVQFLGVVGSQIAPTMAGGLELTETVKGVLVTSKAHPGRSYVIFNANIAHIEYRTEERVDCGAV